MFEIMPRERMPYAAANDRELIPTKQKVPSLHCARHAILGIPGSLIFEKITKSRLLLSRELNNPPAALKSPSNPLIRANRFNLPAPAAVGVVFPPTLVSLALCWLRLFYDILSIIGALNKAAAQLREPSSRGACGHGRAARAARYRC